MFSRLKLYTVHTKAASGTGADRPIFLREGFSLSAFIFTFLWALYHRCYRFAAIIFLAYTGVSVAMYVGFLNPVSAAIAQMLIQLLIGFHANDFLRARLARDGYVFQDITSGESITRAEQRYFDRLVAYGV